MKTSQPDPAPQRFARGGEVYPMPGLHWMMDLARFADIGPVEPKKTARTSDFIPQMRAVGILPPAPTPGIDQGNQLAEIEELLRTAKSGSPEESFYRDQIQHLRSSGVQTPLQSGYSTWLTNGRVLNWALNAANSPAPVSSNSSPASISPPPPTDTSGSGNLTGGRTTIPQVSRRASASPTPLARYVGDTYTVKQGDTVSGIEKMTGTTRPEMLNYNRSLIANPNLIEPGQVLRLRPEPYVPAAPMSEITTRRVGGKEVQAGNMFTMGKPQIPNWAITPVAGTSSSSSSTPGIGLGTMMDISRIITGAAIARKPVSNWQPSTLFTSWQRAVEARKNQGLSSEEMALANQNIAGNYGAGVRALTQSVGGGANPGVVLAGLNNLGSQQAGQQSVLAAADAARRNQNFAQYGSMANQDLEISRTLYGNDLQREQGRQVAGLGLIAGGMQNIHDRQMYNQAYGPNSTFQQLQQSQIDLAKESVKNQKIIIQNTLNNANRILAQPTPDSNDDYARKQADFVTKLTPELKEQYKQMYPGLKF
ncbi:MULTISPECIES: LysM peptidoglycan-binding domain-containing protein [Larkinella]|nr:MULTISPECIES: LysM domain-containing protein [Larkinella]